MGSSTRRMNPAIYLCLILVGLSTVTHGHHVTERQNSTAPHKLSATILKFGFQLYQHFSSASPNKNVFFSPISITSPLVLLSLGAKSDTHTQLLEGLGFNLTQIQEKEIHDGLHDTFAVLTRSDNLDKIDIGQALFLKDELNPLQTFLHDVKEHFEADVFRAKFQEPHEAEKQINDYVKNKTHGMIEELVKGLDQETVLVIVSYIVFKGDWKFPFDPESTREDDFFVDSTTTVRVPMMHRLGWFHYYFDSDLSCTVLQMDYNGTATAFFVLPEKGKMHQLEAALSAETATKWAENIRRGTASVFFPKFTISTTSHLKEALIKLGIDIFSNQVDLSGITGKPDLKVSKVTHKAVLTINERGTEAAAATAVEAIPMSLPPTISYNSPFLVMIYEKNTKTTAFLGKIVNPKES
ncbi:alpha-1-antitrypsin-like isoform X2 [Hemicordylus capensis]|uniref:alpha-1-antitrypsin-like isoform X2 n=1 Tax=Hemicordylus capensis TaxID=884348 RepID=UPI0023032094|nr:alpha-1-antitrypsin-like isoform X2 [Hemicordylus capensis]